MEDRYSVSILCGGKSERMGQDKAMIGWHGRPLLWHIIEGFKDCDDLILSVRDEDQYRDYVLPGEKFPDGGTDLSGKRIPGENIPLRRAVDQYCGKGPLAGLCASLQAAKHEILFITTCDAPLVDIRTARILTDALRDHDCVVPVSENNRVHPLIAVYKKAVLNRAVKHLENDDLKILSLLQELDTVYFPGEKLPMGDITLSNLNTFQDVGKLASVMKNRILPDQK